MKILVQIETPGDVDRARVVELLALAVQDIRERPYERATWTVDGATLRYAITGQAETCEGDNWVFGEGGDA